MISVGYEIEFATDESFPSEMFRKLPFVREYYSWMGEYNDIYCVIKEPKEISLMEHWNGLIDVFLRVFDYINDNKIYLQGYNVPSYNSVVGIGTHLHIKNSRWEIDDSFFRRLKTVRDIAIYLKLKKNPTLRFLMSHHIWGRLRENSYDFKKKPKFMPIFFTRLGTLEFRLFDFEDYFDQEILDFIFYSSLYLERKISKRELRKRCNIPEIYRLIIKDILETPIEMGINDESVKDLIFANLESVSTKELVKRIEGLPPFIVERDFSNFDPNEILFMDKVIYFTNTDDLIFIKSLWRIKDNFVFVTKLEEKNEEGDYYIIA